VTDGRTDGRQRRRPVAEVSETAAARRIYYARKKIVFSSDGGGRGRGKTTVGGNNSTAAAGYSFSASRPTKFCGALGYVPDTAPGLACTGYETGTLTFERIEFFFPQFDGIVYLTDLQRAVIRFPWQSNDDLPAAARSAEI